MWHQLGIEKYPLISFSFCEGSAESWNTADIRRRQWIEREMEMEVLPQSRTEMRSKRDDRQTRSVMVWWLPATEQLRINYVTFVEYFF